MNTLQLIKKSFVSYFNQSVFLSSIFFSSQINWCALVLVNAVACPMSREQNAIDASLDIIGIPTGLVVYRATAIH